MKVSSGLIERFEEDVVTQLLCDIRCSCAEEAIVLSMRFTWWCRYLYRHNYTTSVPEVYYEVNRPDLNALYVNQLIQRDFSTQGSTDDWVKYLTTSESSHLEC